jgi:hypothetical protein
MSGKKYDEGKAPIFRGVLQYFPLALAAVAEVSAFGAQKYQVPYEDQNWRLVDDGKLRYEDALSRHTLDYAGGEMYAQDSKLLHAAHRAWNALAVLELILSNGGGADYTEEQPDDGFSGQGEQYTGPCL